MDEDRRGGAEQGCGRLDATARIEQPGTLVGDADVESEVVVGIQVVDDLGCEMVYVHNDSCEAGRLQFHDYMPQKGVPVNLNECFGTGVGHRFEAGSQPCRKNHCLHHACKVKQKL